QIKETVSFHVGTEYAKYRFIEALDDATNLDDMISALRQASDLSEARQDLIDQWASSTSTVAQERAAALAIDDYTVNLAEIAGKSDVDLAFLAANLLDA